MSLYSVHPRLPCGSSGLRSDQWRSDHRRKPIMCVRTAEKSARVATVSNGDDSLVICRVLNGMWQTSGGWGRIDRDDAVEAMLRHADGGLTTFDMADHCMLKTLNPNLRPYPQFRIFFSSRFCFELLVKFSVVLFEKV